MKWQDVLKYTGAGSVSLFFILTLILNLSGMSYTVPEDQYCTDCYSQIQVNSTYWEIKVEYAGDRDIIFKKRTRSRTLYLNLDKINEFVITNPKVFVEILVPTIKKYSTYKHPEFGYLRPLKDGDKLIERKNKYNPDGDRFIIHGKTSGQTVKWGLEIEHYLMEDIEFDPIWFGTSPPTIGGGGEPLYPNNNTQYLDVNSINFTFNASASGTHNISGIDNYCMGNWWFEQNSSDISGNGNDGTVYGDVVNVSGIVGGAYEFDGIDGYLNINNAATIESIDTGTLNLWFKTNVLNSTTSPFLVSETTSPNEFLSFFIGTDVTGTCDAEKFLLISAANEGVTLICCVEDGVDYTDNSWHMMTYQKDGTAKPIIYLDGIEKSLTATSACLEDRWNDGTFFGVASNPDEVSIGRRKLSGAEVYFNGSIDEVLIFNRTLSSGEISALYNNSRDAILHNCSLLLNKAGAGWETNSTNKTAITEGANHTFNVNFSSSDQDMLWKIGCYDDLDDQWNSSAFNLSLTYSILFPIVENQAPPNNTVQTEDWDVDFIFNVSSNQTIENCSLLLNINSAGWTINDTIYGWVNQTDGFDVSSLSDWQRGLTTNGSDFWYSDLLDDWVYHLNSTGDNQTDGFDLRASGCGNPIDITTNGSDFWVADNGDMWIYHYDADGTNITDVDNAGFPINNPSGITTNGSDLWIMSPTDDKIYHTTLNGTNIDSFSYETETGGTTHNGLVTNGSDFWIAEYTRNWVYHLNSTFDNQTDGFDVSFSGSTGPVGLTTPSFIMAENGGGTPTEFYILDWTDQFIYHLKTKGFLKESVNNTFSVTFSPINQNIDWKIQCYDDLSIPGNSSQMYLQLLEKKLLLKEKIKYTPDIPESCIKYMGGTI